MTSKELVLAAIERKEVARIPWIPFCGVHTGKLIGCDATEYLQSADNIVAGLTKAIAEYRPDGIPVVFDLQIEAEILGCELNWAKDNPPAVISHPLSELGDKKLDELSVIKAHEGRIPLVIDVTKRLRKANPDLALYGLITGPFTLALHLLGADIFMKMFDDAAYVNEVMNFCVANAKAMSRFYIENGCDIVAIVDPMTSQIGPEQFEEFCLTPCREIFDYIRELNAKGSFFVCGHAQNNISVMCDSHCDNISIDENIPLDYVKEICDAKGVSYGGNLQLTGVLLFGSEEDCKINAVECMDIGGKRGFLLAPGCDIAFDTPPENLKAVAAVVHDTYQQDVARELANNRIADDECVATPDYSNNDFLTIDMITLDSEGCAPCQYMVEAVEEAAKEFPGKVVCKEYKIKTKAGIGMMKSLGVSNIPTACMDGEIVYISRIPSKEKLIEKIEEYLAKK